IRGHTVAQALDAVPDPVEGYLPDAQKVYHAIMHAAADVLKRIGTADAGEVVVEGTAAVLRQPEFGHTEVIRELVAFLEERRQLFSLLRDVYDEESRIIIGSEHSDRRMQMCSLVLARYTVLGRYAGTIGVLGPTRMDYDRTLPVVRFMARSVGELLTQLRL
ncbi:MAG TPA: HrcA family transcriptional regulator, partial [Armatimonadota bacterium]|nr:HrcA family transcriptional regulator [Armatimonadota bacterium]